MGLTWDPVPGATHYIVLRDGDGTGPLPELQEAVVPAASYTHAFRSLLHREIAATYRVQACDGLACGSPGDVFAPDLGRAIGYFKATNPGANDQFGYSVALSADGSTMAVGAYLEDSAAQGIDGDQDSNGAADSGAVYLYVKEGGTWTRQAYIKASNAGAGDNFGWAVALSASGDVLAVGALREDGGSTGVDGDASSNALADSGAVYVFRRTSGAWHQEAYIKASNTGAGDNFGTSVALSADGSILATGAFREDGGLPASDAAAQNDNSARDAGAAYVFVREVNGWRQHAYVKAHQPHAGDFFGVVALSAGGDTLAVGALGEDSDATGIDGDPNNRRAPDAGAAYVFDRAGVAWTQAAYVKASNTGAGDNFGISISLSAAGDMLAVRRGRTAARAGRTATAAASFRRSREPRMYSNVRRVDGGRPPT